MEHGCKKPRGCLMIEHRLIERAIKLMEAETKRLESGGALEPLTIDTIVDFIRTYADRCHHGKEEDLLFEDLSRRPLSTAERDLMNELVEEHKLGRSLTNELVEAKNDVLSGRDDRVADVISTMKALTAFYPPHIEKEDAHFFPNTERHYTQEELEAMIQSFYTFDMRMIHEKYASVLDAM